MGFWLRLLCRCLQAAGAVGAAEEYAAQAGAVRAQVAAERRLASLLAALQDTELAATAKLQVTPRPPSC